MSPHAARAFEYRWHGPTPLNLEVNARYAACHGKHRSSGVSIVREYKAVLHSFWICAACDVPIRAQKAEEWNNGVVGRAA